MCRHITDHRRGDDWRRNRLGSTQGSRADTVSDSRRPDRRVDGRPYSGGVGPTEARPSGIDMKPESVSRRRAQIMVFHARNTVGNHCFVNALSTGLLQRRPLTVYPFGFSGKGRFKTPEAHVCNLQSENRNSGLEGLSGAERFREIRMAFKRSGVRFPLAPPDRSGARPETAEPLRLSG